MKPRESLTHVRERVPLLLDRYNYVLPAVRIAQQPNTRRDHSKLLVLNRNTGRILHRQFHQIEKYFAPGDLLIVNDSRVMPCRLFGRKTTGGKVELLLLEEITPGKWKGLVRNVGWEDAAAIRFENPAWEARVMPGGESGVREIHFNRSSVADLMEDLGQMPIPPYIKREVSGGEAVGRQMSRQAGWDRLRYQTTYADRPGSAAAPTAGMHFTPDLLDRLRDLGVIVVPITLHVGYGTFQLIEEPDVSAHKLHPEYFRISRLAARTINESRARGGKIFAVGTTAVRTLENAADASGNIVAGSGWTNLYVCGNYRFKAVDHLITNFHLPKSSLLVLAAAFAGRDKLFRAYQSAMDNGYRFYSYGDAMLIL